MMTKKYHSNIGGKMEKEKQKQQKANPRTYTISSEQLIGYYEIFNVSTIC